ncbi:hypothetical protein [Radicibacter daui]|uniref:hypothetical protein n=1 Tax=Radicibacter daui TaxID=3064829 RepID=UPI004046BD2E
MYLSITGLRLRSPWYAPRFYWHAIRSTLQAQRAEGNLYVSVKTIDGVRHTVTAWRDREAMRAFLIRGAHLGAMRAFGAIATGSTLGFEVDRIPDWAEARKIWEEKARDYAPGSHRPTGS